MIQVAIVEDSAVVRHGLETTINNETQMRCICSCGSAEEALKQLPRLKPEVVLMDIQLPNLSGIECTAQLKQLLPSVQIVMVTVYEDTNRIFDALKAGACGYLLKRSIEERVVAAILEAKQGGVPMTSVIARKLIATFQAPPVADHAIEGLSRREIEILELLAHGHGNKQIAAKLSISANTIHWHLNRIYEKLHVNSRTQAVMKFKGGSLQ